MADTIIITPAPIFINANTYQDVNSITDVGAYDQVDILLNLISIAGTGTLTVHFLTGIGQPINSDDKNWQAGSAASAGNVSASTANKFQTTTIPASSRMLGRYIRWYATLGGLSSATFTLSALARRKGS